jgi:hypothetical protein
MLGSIADQYIYAYPPERLVDVVAPVCGQPAKLPLGIASDQQATFHAGICRPSRIRCAENHGAFGDRFVIANF